MKTKIRIVADLFVVEGWDLPYRIATNCGLLRPVHLARSDAMTKATDEAVGFGWLSYSTTRCVPIPRARHVAISL